MQLKVFWIVQKVVDQTTRFTQLNVVVIWKALFGKILLKISTMAFKFLAIRNERERPVPSYS